MNNIKGFRFRPTDVELIEYLQDKTFDRDSLVQVIALVQDICQFEPWQLPELSMLQTGDGLWYFMYPPKYKYRNSKRISRTTPEGYWKPTGIPRKIINSDTGEEIGSKKTLVFYKGQCHDKIKNKTCWVMHEYELKVKAGALATISDQKILNLCKLKKKVDISSSEAGQPSQHTLSNLVNLVANDAISEDLLELNRSIEPEESNGYGSVVNQSSSSVETYAGERSNQHNIFIVDEGSNSSSHSINPVAEDTIPQDKLGLKEVPTEGNGSTANNKIQNLYIRIEQDNRSSNSILTNDDKSLPTERSNQHNMVDAAEEFEIPSNLEYLAHDDDFIPSELLDYYVKSLHELLTEPDAANDSNWIQDQQFLTNKGDGDAFLNSSTANITEAYLQEGNKLHYLSTNNEGFGLPWMDVMESSNSMEKSRKRPRIEDAESSHRRETGEAQPCGKKSHL